MENYIHPTAIVEEQVSLGSNNYIGPFCKIGGLTEIGDNNYFDSYVSVGSPPQDDMFDLKDLEKYKRGINPFAESKPVIKIGSSNVFREFVTVHSPIMWETIIGDNCYLMTQSHVPHDAIIKDRVKIANSCHIGGFSIIMSDSYLGLSSSVHQFSVVGSMSMVGMNSCITRDIFPGSLVAGTPAKTIGPNKVKLAQHFTDYEWWNSVRENSGVGEVPVKFTELINEFLQMKELKIERKTTFSNQRENFKSAKN